MLNHSKTHQSASSESAYEQYKAEVRKRFPDCPYEHCQGVGVREPYSDHALRCDCLNAAVYGGESAPEVTVPWLGIDLVRLSQAILASKLHDGDNNASRHHDECAEFDG